MEGGGGMNIFLMAGPVLAKALLLPPLGTILGAMVGAAAGLVFGSGLALLTFGMSLAVSPVLGAFLGGLLGGSAGCFMGLRLCFGRVEASLLYHPRRYKDQELLPDSVWQLGAQLYASEKLSYSVRNWRGSSFPQSALLLKPQSGDVDVLWVLFGGNAMLATDWLPFCTRLLTARGASPKLPGVAFLLVDYPGYGSNLGEPTPGSILKGSCEAIRAALLQIKGSTGIARDPPAGPQPRSCRGRSAGGRRQKPGHPSS
ncbi:unnamed protein product [Polarella glacialis]|uniref:Uncharacterized protein n=1 Tax=Polarella glacialis TaxID=89957 RepID=A0A813L9Z8_POLGL|nr:unnamed protein product [Polarella glacialis]CAE8721020.1 unnamed protein product [Polarella glacialis]